MKKIIYILMTIMPAMLFTACGSGGGMAATSDSAKPTNVSTETVKTAPADERGKILVAYFSCTGNTKTLAEDAAAALKADVFEIKPTEPYTSEDLNYHNENSRANIEQKNDNTRPQIANRVEGMARYETVIIAYPIWWAQAPRIIDTFIESYDFTGKNIVPICTSGGSDIGSSADYLQRFAPSAKWHAGKKFNSKASQAELLTWFKELKITQ